MVVQSGMAQLLQHRTQLLLYLLAPLAAMLQLLAQAALQLGVLVQGHAGPVANTQAGTGTILNDVMVNTSVLKLSYSFGCLVQRVLGQYPKINWSVCRHENPESLKLFRVEQLQVFFLYVHCNNQIQHDMWLKMKKLL